MRCTIRISCRPCAPSQHSDTWPDTWPTHPFFSEQTAHSGPPKNLHSNARACELLGSAAAVVNLNIPQLPPAPPSLPLPPPPPPPSPPPPPPSPPPRPFGQQRKSRPALADSFATVRTAAGRPHPHRGSSSPNELFSWRTSHDKHAPKQLMRWTNEQLAARDEQRSPARTGEGVGGLASSCCGEWAVTFRRRGRRQQPGRAESPGRPRDRPPGPPAAPAMPPRRWPPRGHWPRPRPAIATSLVGGGRAVMPLLQACTDVQ